MDASDQKSQNSVYFCHHQDCGNQRKPACQRNMEKQSDLVKRKHWYDKLSAVVHKQKDLEIRQQKLEKANEKK